MDWDAFFTVHKDLPREGPGSADDVAWALDAGAVPEGATICDAGAGPGGDVPALLARAGRVTAVEQHPGFVEQMRAWFGDDPRVTVVQGDMAEMAALDAAPFDMIWCAGALYFLGLDRGPAIMAEALKPGGVLAFSEPCFFTDQPSDDAKALWEGYSTRDVAGICSAVEAAGFDVLKTRKVSVAGWEVYFAPMEKRIAELQDQADEALAEVLVLCSEEAARWRRVRDETGYLLVVARRT